MKKAKKIIGISLIIIVLLVAIFGILYLKTDLLDFCKKPKKLFYAYLIQNKEGAPEFNYSETVKKIREEPCEENGEIYWNFDLKNVDKETKIGIDILNNIKIKYNGKANLKENKLAYNMDLNYEGDSIATLDTIFTEDAFGIKVKEIYDKYIAIENNNLKDLAEKLGIDSSMIPDKLEFNQTLELDTLSEEEFKTIKETYLDVLDESINEENYTRTKETIEINGKEVDTKAYTLTLSEEEAKTIVINMLGALKKDDTLLNYVVNNVNKINEANYGEEYEKIKKSDLKMILSYLISSLEDTDTNSNEKLTFTVYESKGKTVRTKISLAEMNLTLDREQNGKNIDMNLTMELDKEEIMSVNIDMIKEKNNNEIKVSLNIEDIKMQIKLQYNEDMTENTAELVIETEDGTFKISNSSKLEYKQIEIDESIFDNAEVLNEKSIEEMNELITKLQEEATKYIEENQSKFITE